MESVKEMKCINGRIIYLISRISIEKKMFFEYYRTSVKMPTTTVYLSNAVFSSVSCHVRNLKNKVIVKFEKSKIPIKPVILPTKIGRLIARENDLQL